MKSEGTSEPRKMDRRTFNQLMASLGICAAIEPRSLSAATWQTDTGNDARKRMPAISFDKLCYRIEGQPFYLYSGEFHYFRVPKKDWRRRMDLFREAGGNCIATYMPWMLHEPKGRAVQFRKCRWIDRL